MERSRLIVSVLIAGTALLTLIACQNTVGTAGRVPDNCAVPGSSCISANPR